MFARFFAQVRHDFVSFSFLAFLVLYLVYLVVVRIHVYLYERKHRSKPLHYKLFRLYSKSLISNAPSKKEKKFYRQTNKITFFFNMLLVLAFVAYLIICFM